MDVTKVPFKLPTQMKSYAIVEKFSELQNHLVSPPNTRPSYDNAML